MRLRHAVISLLAAASVGAPAVAADSTVLPGAPGSEANLLTIETSDKPLETVLQWISRRAGVNVVCNEPDQPRVTLRLVNVTWQESVQQIAQKYDLVIERKSDRIWVLAKPPKVRMEFQDARLGVVLEALARQAGVNIVFSDIDADKRITMTLNLVPWKHALDVIVRDVGYAWVEREYNIIQIVTADKLQKDLQTRILQLNNSTAESLKDIAAQNLGGDGKVVVDARSNSLILTGTAPALDATERMVAQLDARTRQVQISMKFVEFSDSDVQRLGFDPFTLGFDVANLGHLDTAFRPFNAVPTSSIGLARSLASIPKTTGNISGQLTLEAIQLLNSTETLQEPTVLTTDNQQALIEIGREIHFSEEKVTQENLSTVRTLSEAQTSPVKDGIVIKVTPHITGDGFVTINLEATNDEVTLETFTNKNDPNDPNASTIRLPQKKITKLATTIMVADGKTGVIGGILRNVQGQRDGSVPMLGDIPILGHIFRKTESTLERRNLTIFITPRIVRFDRASEYEQKKAEMRERLIGPRPQAPVVEAQGRTIE